MAIDFTVRDIIHRIAVKFIHAFLPEAKKPYYVKAVHQPELDIHGIASKAEVYNIAISPKVIEEGLNAGIELMYYLAADGFKIKTPLFNLRIRVPGEYDGSETHLPDGVYPMARLQTNAAFRSYLKNNVKIEFDGVDSSDGIIGEAVDEATGQIDEVMTIGNILTIHGYGLKIEGDENNKSSVGLFFNQQTTVKADVIAVNEHRTIKVVVPSKLTPGLAYRISIVTQSSAKGSSSLLKNTRTVEADFTLIAQA